MKILLVSMNSIHFVRWTQQLEDSGHEVYWFDILDGGKTAQLPWAHQITGWKQKFPNLKGRHFLKKNLSYLYEKSKFLIENDVAETFESIVQEIQPDLVHSFVLYLSCSPILKVMKKHHNLPWLYSSWGSDLYYFKNIEKNKQDILNVLPRVNYLITDCKRDVAIAKDLGFNGKVLGTFPGGGGFNYTETDPYITPISERKTILVKGYQGRSGRAIEVLQAMLLIPEHMKNHHIIVFGADDEVENHIKDCGFSKTLSIETLSRKDFLPHIAILKLMGAALIYIGNSNSDGMPNTLLEAIAMGAFPIQSNPGGASSEVVAHYENGLLIEDFNDIEEIKSHILTALNTSSLLEKAFKINQNKVKPQFERGLVKQHILDAYHSVMKKGE
tara:strand:- start:127968 stop:129125 length:1158 start_codon:yes stop_codon:yes gene_type:complete